jgi:hypothetical protein
MAADCTGETTRAISGKARSPIPEKPPFASPRRVTAGTAAA